MDFNDLFSADWWNSPGGEAPVSALREQMEPTLAPMRNGNGSLDPANITPEKLKQYGISPSATDDVREIVGLGAMRKDAMRDTYKMPDRSPLEFLSQALSAASVPVAYAQGNDSYGRAMTGNTLADKWQQRRKAYEDAAIQDHRDIVSDTFGSVDKTVQSIQAGRRERQQRALSGAEVLVRQGKYQDAMALLESNGLKEHASALGERLKGAASGQGPGFQGAPTTPPPAQPGAVPPQPNSPISSSPMPGVSVAPPQPAPAAGNPPPGGAGVAAPPGGPPMASGVGGMGIPPYQMSPEAQKLIDEATFARSMGREDLAKIAEDQAKLIDAPRAEAAKSEAQKLGEGEAERTNKEIKNFEAAPKVGQLFDMLGQYSETKGFDYYTGPLDASWVAPYTTDIMAKAVPWNKASPAIRDQIKGTQMALVNILKSNIRTPGEGSQDQREFQAVIDTVGDMTNATNAADYQQKLNDALARVEAFTGVKIPTTHKAFKKRTSAGVDEAGGGDTKAGAAPRVSAAQEPEGAERTIRDEKGALVKVRRTNGQWVEVGPVAPTTTPVNRATYLGPRKE